MRDSFLVNGVAFKKTFSYAGFEQQPKKFLNPKILLLNIELELKSEKENAEIRYPYRFTQAPSATEQNVFSVLYLYWLYNFHHTCRLSDPLQYQSIVDAEWNIIYDKLDKCVKSGAKIVLSRLAIGDLGTQVVRCSCLTECFSVMYFCSLSQIIWVYTVFCRSRHFLCWPCH
jgi:T-complex protein 1 subunit eta